MTNARTRCESIRQPNWALVWQAVLLIALMRAVSLLGAVVLELGMTITSGEEAIRSFPLDFLLILLALWFAGSRGLVSRDLVLGCNRSDARLAAALAVSVVAMGWYKIPAAFADYHKFFFVDYLVFHVFTSFGNVVRAPLVEEIAWRGMLLCALLPLGRRRAVVLSSIAFMLWHLSPIRMYLTGSVAMHPGDAVRLIGLGLVTGYAYQRTGRLAVPILLHATYNGCDGIAPLIRFLWVFATKQ